MPYCWPGWPSPSLPRAGDLQNPRARAERRSGPAPPARPILRHPTIGALPHVGALPHDMAPPGCPPARLQRRATGGRSTLGRCATASDGDGRREARTRGPCPAAASARSRRRDWPPPWECLRRAQAARRDRGRRARPRVRSARHRHRAFPIPPRRRPAGSRSAILGRGSIPLGLTDSVDPSVGSHRNGGFDDSVSVNRAAVPGGVARAQVRPTPFHSV